MDDQEAGEGVGVVNQNVFIIDAEETCLIPDLEVQIEQTEKKRKKVELGELEKGFDEANVYNRLDEGDDLNLLPGSNLRLSLVWWKCLFLVNITGFFTKKQLKSRYGYLYRFWQVIATALIATYHLFQFGIGKLSSKHIRPVVVAESNYPFTYAHDVLWQLKWSVAYVLGMAYFGSGHIEVLVSCLRLPRDVFKKARRHCVWYVLIITTLVLILPAAFHALQLYDSMQRQSNEKNGSKADKYENIVICDLLYLAFRIATVPSFCIVTAVLYLVKVSIDTLGRTLKCINVSLGEPYAEREIRDCKNIIRAADIKLKWYLSCHMALILMTAFTGLFSCIERMEFKMAKNNNATVSSTVKLNNNGQKPNAKMFIADIVQLKQKMQKLDHTNQAFEETNMEEDYFQTPEHLKQVKALIAQNIELQKVNKRLMNITLGYLLNAEKTPSKMVTIKSSDSGPSHLQLKFHDEEARSVRVFLESIVGFLEVVVLFLIPLTLLAWHERALLRIADEVTDLDVEEQRRLNLLINNKNTKCDIVSELKKMRGVTIFGLQVSLYKGAFITMLAPFITVTLHVMFSHYGIKS